MTQNESPFKPYGPGRLAAIYTAGRAYLAAGLSLVPVAPYSTLPDASALGGMAWRIYQQRQPTPAELDQWRAAGAGLGVVCGLVSGGLAVLDFEDAALYRAWWRQLGSVRESLAVERSPAGYHVLYRARRPRCVRPATRISPAVTLYAEQHYVVLAPGRGPTGRSYVLLHGNPAGLPLLGASQAALLLADARRLCAPLTHR